MQEILHVLLSLSAYQDQQGVQLWCLVFYMSTYRKASKKTDHELMKNTIIKGLSLYQYDITKTCSILNTQNRL